MLQEYFDYDISLKILKHKNRPDEHCFCLNNHTLITIIQKIGYQGFFYIK